MNKSVCSFESQKVKRKVMFLLFFSLDLHCRNICRRDLKHGNQTNCPAGCIAKLLQYCCEYHIISMLIFNRLHNLSEMWGSNHACTKSKTGFVNKSKQYVHVFNSVHTSIFVLSLETQCFINLHFICSLEQTTESQRSMDLIDWKAHTIVSIILCISTKLLTLQLTFWIDHWTKD